jgi:hypothetical protein
MQMDKIGVRHGGNLTFNHQDTKPQSFEPAKSLAAGLKRLRFDGLWRMVRPARPVSVHFGSRLWQPGLISKRSGRFSCRRFLRSHLQTICVASFGFQLREQDHVADAFLAEQHHAQAVNADGNGTGGVGQSTRAGRVGTGGIPAGTRAETKSTGAVGDSTGGVGKGTGAVRKSTCADEKSTGAFSKSTGDAV